MDINTNVTPIKSNDRIDYLDILRGIAILFIFTANIPFFSGLWFFEPNHPIREVNWASDEWVNFIMYTFVDGKFYTIFSLLFGIGFYLQFNKNRDNQPSFMKMYYKRLSYLMLFGLIHMFFWSGDILFIYGLVGFETVPFNYNL